MGVKSGTQPEPGLYVSSIYYRYCTDTIKDPNGKPLELDPTRRRQADDPRRRCRSFYYVTPKKVLGAQLRDDGRAAVRQRLARSAGPRPVREGQHRR